MGIQGGLMDNRTRAAINACNAKKMAYKLRTRENKDGSYMLYATLQRRNEPRRQITLGITITGKSSDLPNDKRQIEIAYNKLNEMNEKHRINKNIKYIDQSKLAETDLIKYMIAIAQGHMVKSTRKNFMSAVKQLKLFSGKNSIKFSEVDNDFCLEFVYYLERINLSARTSKNYFGMFKSVIYKAIDAGIMINNPVLNKRIKKQDDKKERVFLTWEELNQIYNTEYDIKPHYKNAFIFTCLCGLRFVDVYKLKFEDINNGRMRIKQSKTQKDLNVPLGNDALSIIELQKLSTGRNTGLVFELSQYENYRMTIKEIARKAGIHKNITAHTGRHTYAMIALHSGIPIDSVMQLLGHSDIKHTLIYAHLTYDGLKKEAKKFPKLELKESNSDIK